MESYLHWEKGVFKSTYEILPGEMVIGNLTPDSWSNGEKGELNGKRYIFETKRFFKQETQIFYSDSYIPIAKIAYNSWMTKVQIEYSGNVYSWSFDNFWSTKWSLQNSEGPFIWYHLSSSEGIIETEGQNNLLLLTGLFIHNFYLQAILILIMAIFLPLMPVFFN